MHATLVLLFSVLVELLLMPKILLVEDDVQIAEALENWFKQESIVRIRRESIDLRRSSFRRAGNIRPQTV